MREAWLRPPVMKKACGDIGVQKDRQGANHNNFEVIQPACPCPHRNFKYSKLFANYLGRGAAQSPARFSCPAAVLSFQARHRYLVPLTERREGVQELTAPHVTHSR